MWICKIVRMGFCTITPLQDGAPIKDTNLCLKLKKELSTQRLGQSTCKLIFGRDIWYDEIPTTNMITYKVKVDSNVLHFWVKNRIDRKVGCTNVVTIYNRCLKELKAKFTQKIFEPKDFCSCASKDMTFNLHGRLSNKLLLARASRYNITTKVDNICSSRGPVIPFASLINIKKGR